MCSIAVLCSIITPVPLALQALGYTLVTVPYFEWDALPSHQARREYMVAKLKGRHGAGGASGSALPRGFTVSTQVVSRKVVAGG